MIDKIKFNNLFAESSLFEKLSDHMYERNTAAFKSLSALHDIYNYKNIYLFAADKSSNRIVKTFDFVILDIRFVEHSKPINMSKFKYIKIEDVLNSERNEELKIFITFNLDILEEVTYFTKRSNEYSHGETFELS